MRRIVSVCVPNHVTAIALVVAAWACLFVALPEARAQTMLSVSSTSNIYASGLSSIPIGMAPNGPGGLPPSVNLAPGTGRVLRFLSVSGSVSYNNDILTPAPYRGQFNGPDGGAV